jgi:hypothetical protein
MDSSEPPSESSSCRTAAVGPFLVRSPITLMPQIGHRIDERALMRDARSGAGARRGDLALAGHIPDQFRKPGGLDDHRRDIRCNGRLAVIPSEVCVAETSEPAAG